MISGAIFGAYHLQITNFLPLATLGVFLAYLTYVSDSLVPAMVAHFVNNGGQVIASSFYPEMLEQEITSDMELPIALVVISIVVTSFLLYYLYQIKQKEESE